MKNFILDLDQTLISAEPTEEYNYKNNKIKQKQFVFHNMEDFYIVFERPYLQEFLDYLFKNFNVSVWTAGSKDYALYIIEKIILRKEEGKEKGKGDTTVNLSKERKLDYIFFSYHCNISKHILSKSKQLDMLWDVYKIPSYTKENTYILDDYDDVYKEQIDNAIIAKPFEFNDEDSSKDDFLKNLIPKLELLKDDRITVKEINDQLSMK